jgi:hypothetical protein
MSHNKVMQTKGSIGRCSLKSSQLPSLADRWRSVISLLIVLVLVLVLSATVLVLVIESRQP